MLLGLSPKLASVWFALSTMLPAIALPETAPDLILANIAAWIGFWTLAEAKQADRRGELLKAIVAYAAGSIIMAAALLFLVRAMTTVASHF